MRKKTNTTKNSKAGQEIRVSVYDPTRGGYVTRDIYPLLQSKDHKGRSRLIAKCMEEDVVSSSCSLLDIPEPDVEYTSKGFPSKTMVAEYSPQNDIVYINNSGFDFGIRLFGIASAIRADWLHKTNPSCLADVKPRFETGLEEYNRQKPIIDTLAFGSLMMNLLFHWEPPLNNLSDILLDKIQKRKELIYKELKSAGKIGSANQ